jgi:hypothetical protein
MAPYSEDESRKTSHRDGASSSKHHSSKDRDRDRERRKDKEKRKDKDRERRKEKKHERRSVLTGKKVGVNLRICFSWLRFLMHTRYRSSSRFPKTTESPTVLVSLIFSILLMSRA